ncbi:MAG: ribosomal L7Ae/L30e/S12e/Gadd45 family protein [Clostridia bacterium]|nr:ribosomal L7Ae/L30e/S12e/Gadd45 family protein [Clostridia bacterium]
MGNEQQGQEKLLAALGLCRKAGKLICGTPLVCDALGSGKKPYLVVCASDNSENTAKRLRDRCAFYGVPMVRSQICGEELSRALGKGSRVAAVAVTDEHLCRLVQGALPSNQ